MFIKVICVNKNIFISINAYFILFLSGGWLFMDSLIFLYKQMLTVTKHDVISPALVNGTDLEVDDSYREKCLENRNHVISSLTNAVTQTGANRRPQSLPLKSESTLWTWAALGVELEGCAMVLCIPASIASPPLIISLTVRREASFYLAATETWTLYNYSGKLMLCHLSYINADRTMLFKKSLQCLQWSQQ